jgi:hypothetical protein
VEHVNHLVGDHTANVRGVRRVTARPPRPDPGRQERNEPLVRAGDHPAVRLERRLVPFGSPVRRQRTLVRIDADRDRRIERSLEESLYRLARDDGVRV